MRAGAKPDDRLSGSGSTRHSERINQCQIAAAVAGAKSRRKRPINITPTDIAKTAALKSVVTVREKRIGAILDPSKMII
jgi:hypothetical protein